MGCVSLKSACFLVFLAQIDKSLILALVVMTAGTAEVPLGGIYMDRILTEADLPIKMAAFGHCFRTEAGAAGEIHTIFQFVTFVDYKLDSVHILRHVNKFIFC